MSCCCSPKPDVDSVAAEKAALKQRLLHKQTSELNDGYVRACQRRKRKEGGSWKSSAMQSPEAAPSAAQNP